GEGDVPYTAYAVLVLPSDHRRRVHRDAGHDLRRADPRPNLGDRPEQPQRGGELVPTVVEHEDPAPLAHLLELPFVAAHRHVPPTAAARDHLQVVANDVTD